MNTINQKRLQALRATARTPEQIINQSEPGVMSGALSAIPQGVVTGVAQVEGLIAGAAETAYQPVLNAIESTTGITPWNPFTSIRGQADTWAQQYKPDPLTTGMVGQVMFDVSRVMTQVGVGAAANIVTGGAAGSAMFAGAATTGAASGRATFQDMTSKGVDAGTAANIGFIDALTIGGGVMMPAAIGAKALATPFNIAGAGMSRGAYYGANVTYGAASNVALGAAQRGATQELLESGGYTAMAQQYAPLDAASVTAEAILGAAFGAIGARSGLPNAAEQAAIDASLVARDAKHTAIDTAPGIPSDPSTAAAHSKSLDAATRQLLSGEPVNVSQTGITDGAFVSRPRSLEASEAARAEYLMDFSPADRYTPSARITALPLEQRTNLRFDAPELNEYAAQVEQQYGLPAGLLNALKNAGERSNSNQVSPVGARGVMQFMPENLRKYGVADPSDPVQMIDAAGRYLRDTMRQYGGHVDAVIADYNGGPRQAKEVLAGRQPKAAETQAYLRRVREWLGRDSSAQRADPSPLPHTPETYTGVTRTPTISTEQANAARAIDTELLNLETERARLIAGAGNEAELRQITTVRDELGTLQQQRTAIADSDPRTLAKEIQASTPRTSYKEALSTAKRQRGTEVAELDSRIERLEGMLRDNKQANETAQRLAKIDEQAAVLRENRASIDTPPIIEQPIIAAVRNALNDMGSSEPNYLPMDSGMPSGASPAAIQARANAQPAPTTRAPARTQPEAQPTLDSRPVTESPRPLNAIDDPETNAGLALLDEKGDIIVPIEMEGGEVVNVSLRQALADADAELQYSTPKAFNAAVVCALTRGA
ncbi:lytic transglycosylase domain-containing protein [Paenalcaligenes suwonensis]|uniref:lytic transglycosylase domain-containing protein n=1 Tax=Paenalcaligenes suwonensis TaxID=1202713 RepID=UPI001407CA76|nr:lytic transglycosylase domain-containing protein [Paenalcaligenes suwonensis]NHC63176.1 transglycosylase SLT domain-containing protein [Paenalcaligenes suwonensis]